MNEIHAPLVVLSPLNESHLQTLFDWRNSSDFLQYCTNRRKILTLEEFKKELQKDFSFDRHRQYIISKKSDCEMIGTIYSYSFKPVDGNIFISTYLKTNSRSAIYGFESTTVFCLWLFSEYESLHKIYMDVYEYNSISLSSLKKAGFVEEGRFKEHRLYDGKRWDMFRLAFYRSQLGSSKRFIDRVRPA